MNDARNINPRAKWTFTEGGEPVTSSDQPDGVEIPVILVALDARSIRAQFAGGPGPRAGDPQSDRRWTRICDLMGLLMDAEKSDGMKLVRP